MNEKQRNTLVILLQMAVVSVFLGRAWQHLFWDAPFRTLLWDEGWMKWVVEGLFGMAWEDYITSMKVDDAIQTMIHVTGIFYILCALVAIFIQKAPKWIGKILLLGSTSLILLAALYCKEKFFSVGQFFEFALQVASPAFLYAVIFTELSWRRLLLYMKIATALTFVCHGLYAINFYPRPGIFVDMILNMLGTDEQTTYTLLYLAGALDFLMSMALFFPIKIARLAALYALVWGLATALARVTSFFDISYAAESLHQWMFETVYRFPHFIIPLVMWLMMGYLRKVVAYGKKPGNGLVVQK